MKKADSKRVKILKKVGLNIQEARKKRGMSQESLALAADIDRSYVGSVERGERNISIINLKKIADALHITSAQLIKDI